MTGNAVIARWHATSLAGQAVMSSADVADSPPRRSLASWLLRQLGPPALPPRRYFYKSVYSVRRTAGHRRPRAAGPVGQIESDQRKC
jgi:hypothetical protein